MKYFTYDNKNATNLGKLYLLPKIHKCLNNVPGRPVLSNWGVSWFSSEKGDGTRSARYYRL